MTDRNHKVSRPQVREAFLRNGARIEPGRDDLPDYVYESVFELLEMAGDTLAATANRSPAMTTNKPRRTKENRPMNRCEGIDLPGVLHYMAAEIATLLGELYRWMESSAFQPIYEEAGASMDHLRSAALQLATHTAHHLDELIDWENSEHGVFAYDYCEVNLPSLLKDFLTPEDWYQMACNYVVPDTLRALLRDWVIAQPELELKVIEERQI